MAANAGFEGRRRRTDADRAASAIFRQFRVITFACEIAIIRSALFRSFSLSLSLSLSLLLLYGSVSVSPQPAGEPPSPFPSAVVNGHDVRSVSRTRDLIKASAFD